MKLTGVALGVIALGAVAGTGVAWYTGNHLERTLTEQLAKAGDVLREQQRPDLEFSLTLDGFERGLYTSEARYRLRLTDPQSGEMQDLVVRDHIEHGPFPVSRLKAGQLAPVMAVSHFQLEDTPLVAGWFRAAGERAPLHGTLVTGYDRDFSGNLQLEPVRYRSVSGDTLVESSGLQLSLQGSAGAEQVRISGNMEQLLFEHVETGKGARLLLGSLQLDSDLQRSASELYLGRNRLGLGTLELRVPGQPPVELRQLEFSDQSSQQGNQLSGQSVQKVGSIRVNDQELGSLQAGFSVDQLDADVFHQFTELLGSYGDALSSEQDSERLKQQLLASVEQLLEKHPRLSLDELSLRTASGEARLSLMLNLTRPAGLGLELPQDLIHQLIQRLELRVAVDKGMIQDLVMFQGELDPKADVRALRQQAQMTADMASSMAVGMQLATLDGQRISSRLDYEDGMIDFNGQRMPAEQFVYMLQSLSGQRGPQDLLPE